MDNSSDAIAELRRALERANRVVALTGAGISAESGVPTFRGPGGLWRNYSPEKLATPEAFAQDPRLVWEWYDWRRGLIQKAQPNPGHLALAELERRKCRDDPAGCLDSNQGGAPPRLDSASEKDVPQASLGFTLVTQNVDGLHDRAGSRNTLKLHGDLWFVRCTGCGAVERNEEVPVRGDLPPRCRCGAVERPAVVWFGEPLPEEVWQGAVKASAGADVFLVIGTSAVVYPAAGLAEVARQAGARLAIVNPEPTPLDDVADWVFRSPSGGLLPRLL